MLNPLPPPLYSDEYNQEYRFYLSEAFDPAAVAAVPAPAAAECAAA